MLAPILQESCGQCITPAGSNMVSYRELQSNKKPFQLLTTMRYPGSGSDSRRKQTMNQHLKSSSLFNEFATDISGDFHGLVKRVLDRLDQTVRDEIANVTQDLRASVAVERDESEAGRDPRYAEELKQKVEMIQGTLAHARCIVEEVG